MPGFIRASRLGWHCASLIEITGTSPVTTSARHLSSPFLLWGGWRIESEANNASGGGVGRPSLSGPHPGFASLSRSSPQGGGTGAAQIACSMGSWQLLMRSAAMTKTVRSLPFEVRHAALFGGLDAFLEILGAAQPGLFGEFKVGLRRNAIGEAGAHGRAGRDQAER